MFDQSGLENILVVFVYGYFTHPSDSWNITTQTQLMCSPQTDQTLTCSCYSMVCVQKMNVKLLRPAWEITFAHGHNKSTKPTRPLGKCIHIFEKCCLICTFVQIKENYLLAEPIKNHSSSFSITKWSVPIVIWEIIYFIHLAQIGHSRFILTYKKGNVDILCK